MSEKQKKLDIRQAITLCDYNNKIKNNFIIFLQSNYSNPKNKLYLFERNKNSPKIFLLLLTIPAKYNNNTYDINILIYFPLKFPLVQPEIYFHKYCSVKINPNCLNYIDEETLKINFDKFFQWGNSFESFKNLIKEIYNQFNINFPIFTFENKNEKNSDQGNCILKQECCKEIELRKSLINNNAKNNNNNRNPLKNQINKNKINTPNIQNTNLQSKEQLNNNIKIKKNEVIINKKNININNINNNNSTKNITNNNNINNKNDELIISNEDEDEDKTKSYIIKSLILELYPKINNINTSMNKTKNNLVKIKNNIISELKEFEGIEKQRSNVEKSMHLMKNELNNYNKIIQSKQNFDENIKDFSNLDTLLRIKNKKIYLLLSKEKAIEEYILILKKAFEKNYIDLNNAMNKVREYSRQIFYIKYKYRSIKNINTNTNKI